MTEYLVEVYDSIQGSDDVEYTLIEEGNDRYHLKTRGAAWSQSFRDKTVLKMDTGGDDAILSFPSSGEKGKEIILNFSQLHELYLVMHRHYEDLGVHYHLIQGEKTVHTLQNRVSVLEEALKSCRDELETEVKLYRINWTDEMMHEFLQPYDDVLKRGVVSEGEHL